MSWLLPPYDDALLSSAFRPAWGRGVIPSLVVQEAISPSAARRLRALAAPGLAGYDVPDRGRYRFATADRLPPLRALAAEVRAFAAAATGLPLGGGTATLLRFARGDYALRLADARTRPKIALLEATLDLSDAAFPSADAIYTEGPMAHLSVPARPGQLALVHRSATGSRCDRYLSCETGRKVAWRVRIAWRIG